MNSTYGTDLSTIELFSTMDLPCIWNISDFLLNPSGPAIDEDESGGPECAHAYAVQMILEMFPQLTEDDEVEIEFLLYNHADREKLASYTQGEESRTENMKEYISLKSEDSSFKVDRFIEVWNLLDDDPNALLGDCYEENEDFEIGFWSSLASFNPPQSVHDRITALGEGWLLQSFTTPTLAPRINLDYFSINISQMPIKNSQTGERWLPEDFFQYVRTNINLFVDTEASEFVPYGMPNATYDNNLWISSNPLTSVISIEIPFDDGSVICSKSEGNNWIFSTLKAPFYPLSEDGYHPVSGNRQFGYLVNANQSVTMYTKGADRYYAPLVPDGGALLLSYLEEMISFAGADALWNSFQNKTSAYINSHGGNSSIIPATKNRPKVHNALKQLLTSVIPISMQNLCGQ